MIIEEKNGLKIPAKYKGKLLKPDFLIYKNDLEYIICFLNRLVEDITSLNNIPEDLKSSVRNIFNGIINVFKDYDGYMPLRMEYKLKKYIMVAEIAEYNNLFEDLKANQDFMKLTALILINSQETNDGEELTRFKIKHKSNFNFIVQNMINI